ncbi:MAG: hypothetical protein ACSLFN_01250 [Candidatus Limnocylindrales bacterium]
MANRWRGRRAGLAIVLALATIAASTSVLSTLGRGDARDTLAVVVRTTDGTVLARVPLPAAGRFALRYRNSLYGSLAEERFIATRDRRFWLQELAADELAVLEEYYAIPGPAERTLAGDRRTWRARPADTSAFGRLTIAATRLGERTLLVPGREDVALWSLVDREPIVIIDLEVTGR